MKDILFDIDPDDETNDATPEIDEERSSDETRSMSIMLHDFSWTTNTDLMRQEMV